MVHKYSRKIERRVVRVSYGGERVRIDGAYLYERFLSIGNCSTLQASYFGMNDPCVAYSANNEKRKQTQAACGIARFRCVEMSHFNHVQLWAKYLNGLDRSTSSLLMSMKLLI